MKSSYKKFILFFILILLFASICKVLTEEKKQDQKISYSDFIREIKKENIEKITLQGKNSINGSFKQKDKNGKEISFKSIGSTGETTLKFLLKYGITPDYAEEEKDILTFIIIYWMPWILIFLMGWNLFKKTPLDKVDNFDSDSFIFEDIGQDDFLREPVGKYKEFHIFDIRFTSSEKRWVRKGIGKMKKKEPLKDGRTGAYIASICKIYIEKSEL